MARLARSPPKFMAKRTNKTTPELLITRTYAVNEDRYLEAVLIALGREDEIYELRERLRNEPQEEQAEAANVTRTA